MKPVAKMTLPELAEIIAKKHRLSDGEAKAILQSTFGVIVRNVKRGRRVQVPKVGLFYLHHHRRSVRTGNLPGHAGKSFVVPGHPHIKFRMSDWLRGK